jgi:hypothetical protein
MISRSRWADDRDRRYPGSVPMGLASSRQGSRSSDRRYDRVRNIRRDMVRIRTGGTRHPVRGIRRVRNHRPRQQVESR